MNPGRHSPPATCWKVAWWTMPLCQYPVWLVRQRPVESSVMKGATVSVSCLISPPATCWKVAWWKVPLCQYPVWLVATASDRRAHVFQSDFLRRPGTSSVVTGETESVVVDAVGTMSGGLTLDVSTRISSTFLEKSAQSSPPHVQ